MGTRNRTRRHVIVTQFSLFVTCPALLLVVINAMKIFARTSFREISQEFLRSEIHQHFFAELLLFGAIVFVSAWPLISLAEALSAASIK
jgi:hypothetical protein